MQINDSAVGVIPARLKSKRFPNKLFAEFLGKPILHHVISNALKLDFLNKIVVATDSEDIIDYVETNFIGVDAINVGKASCGSERSYLYYLSNKDFDYYISIPSDEPCIDPDEVNKVVSKFDFARHVISSFYSSFYSVDDLISLFSCKIVIYNNRMIYNSRAVVPIKRSGEGLKLEEYNKHVGIFIFPRDLFAVNGPSIWSKNSDIESLEQNRFIESSIPVMMYKIKHIGFGIDSSEQIGLLENRVRKLRGEI